MKKLLILIFCVVVGMLFSVAATAQAAIYGVTSRQDLASDDSVDWGRQGYGAPYYGGAHAVGPYIPIPVPAISSKGYTLNVTNPPYYAAPTYNGTTLHMSIRQQSLSWFGCFAPGDILIGNQWDVSGFLLRGPIPDYNIYNIGPGPMTIHFDAPVYGVGAQINKLGLYFPGTFNALIEAFDSNWNTLGQVSFNNLQHNGYCSDNSAPFIGVTSDTGNISHVVIAIGRSGLFINKLDMVTMYPPAFPPTGAIPSSPGTVGGVSLVKKGTNPNAPVTPDTTAGAMLVKNENYMGNAYTIADLSIDSVVQTDIFTGELLYNGGSRLPFGYPANPNIWGDYAILSMAVQIDGVPATLTDLDGKMVKQLKVITNRGSGFVPELNEYHQTFQHVISATLSNNGGNGGGNGNGGGQQTAKPVQFEGSIGSISATGVTVGGVTLTVDSQTAITLNGQTAVLGDLQVGYKAAGKYDSATKHATQIKAEGKGGGNQGGGNGNGGNGGNGGGGNGGQQTAKPKKFEGFIDSIAAVANALEVTVGKEGNFVTVTVDSQTNILINEQSASQNALAQQNGAKAVVKYDPSNNHATEIMAGG